EGDRQALLAGGKVAPVEGVRFLRRREAGILADRPWLLDIHGRIRPAYERSQSGIGVEMRQAVEIGFAIKPLDGDALRRRPLAFDLDGSRRCRRPGDATEIRNHWEASAGWSSRAA